MQDTDVAKVRQAIADEAKRLKVEIKRLEERVKPVAPDNSIGRLSRLDNMVNQEVATRSLGISRRRLLKLEWMLEHVEDDEFGICHDCGDDIPLARLLAVPETALCVECAEDHA